MHLRQSASESVAAESRPTPSNSHRPIRVLFVMHTAANGGAATSLISLIEALPVGTIQPRVVCADGPMVAEFRRSGIEVETIPGVSLFHSTTAAPLRGVRLLLLLRVIWRLRGDTHVRRAIRRFKPDIVHLNESGMVHVAQIANDEQVAVVMHARCVLDGTTPRMNRLWSRLVARYVDCVVAIDDSVRRSLGERVPSRVIYNPLRSKYVDAARTPLAHQTRTAEPGLRVAYLTGLIPFKGIWDLTRAAQLLADRSDIQFFVAGANSRSREFHKSLLGRITRALGLVSDVESQLEALRMNQEFAARFHMLGHVNNTFALLQDSDVLVFPSRLNGVGRSVFEAGVLGVPSIVCLRDRVEDIVEHGVTGLIVPEGDGVALAKAIRMLADDPDLRTRLGEAARKKYSEQFDPANLGLRLLGLYRELVHRASLDHRQSAT